MSDSLVYVVDDDASVRASVAGLLRSDDVGVETFPSAQDLLVRCRTAPPSCLVLDVKLPGLSGLDVQQKLTELNIHVPIVFLTGCADVPTSVRAMKSGALEFLTKPCDGDVLLGAVRQAIARREPARGTGRTGPDAPALVGSSPAFEAVLRRVAAVSPTDATVLIMGETGTGKELVARSIHLRSHRSSRPLVSVNCGAIAPSLLASELFGHERGSFTGAVSQRLGRFELADGGTIFLDEVGELPPEAQVALLRVLQEREFERVGGTRRIHVDVRVIAATNRDLQAEIAAGRFRSDLFYRLNVFPIRVPPLRERREDIPRLVEHFLRLRGGAAVPAAGIGEGRMAALERYAWPGNVRELQNVIERWAIIRGAGDASGDDAWLPAEAARTADAVADPPPPDSLNLRENVELLERQLIGRSMAAACGNQSEAARRLGMSRGALLGRLKKYGQLAG